MFNIFNSRTGSNRSRQPVYLGEALLSISAIAQFIQMSSGAALAAPVAANNLHSERNLPNKSTDETSSSVSVNHSKQLNHDDNYPVLPVPAVVSSTNSQTTAPKFSPPPLASQRQTACQQNCSNADLFVLQYPEAVEQRQISNQTSVNNPLVANAPPSQTYLRQLMDVYGTTSLLEPETSSPVAISSTPNEFNGSSDLAGPNFTFQGVSIGGSDDFSGRARLTATYPVTPHLLLGTSVDTSTGNAFVDSRREGLQLNELYLTASMPAVPNLRLTAGQVDLSSYFDRNSFAKDGATQFFNSAFQTSPAIISSLGDSTLGAVLNWSPTDNLDLRAAAFSSDRDLDDFNIDGYAGEIAFRFDNAIIRGTYASGRDGGENTGFKNSFLIDRGNGQTGILSDDREVAYGINGELFFPDANLGLFGRYGIYENQTLSLTGDSFSIGLTAFDLLTDNDRLGVAYGQTISNSTLRDQAGAVDPDVVEVFYDFEPIDNVMLGLSVQQSNNFEDTTFQFRLRYDNNFNSFRPN